jgi:hypothetical protein
MRAHRPDTSAPPRLLGCFIALIAAGFLVYSQTLAFSWDEGFHLLAAWLISMGRKPYIDFMFAQPPLNALWNALWMLAFGPGWRIPHLVAASISSASIYLAADYVRRRFPVAEWRMAAAVATAASFGLNSAVVQFGSVGQSYALCLFLLVIAYRASVVAVERPSLLPATAAGAASCAAACSSLLTAAAAPVLLVWIFRVNRAGSRRNKCAAFIAGGLAACLPLLWLLLRSPSVVIFDVFEYHSLYRRVEYTSQLPHDFAALTSWVDSAQALALITLAVAAKLWFNREIDVPAASRAELSLCFWLSLVMAFMIASARPTFTWYFLLTVPFLSILSGAGLYVLRARLGPTWPPWRPVAIYTALITLGLMRSFYNARDDFQWSDIEPVADTVKQLLPPGTALFADEHVYLLTRQVPPSGMEYEDSHKLNLTPGRAAELHVLSRAVVRELIKSGRFAVAQTCEEDPAIEELGLKSAYRLNEAVGSCQVFWNAPQR